MSPSGKRPNIVLIMTDQQRFDTINALGADHMKTPNLDRLVAEGITFSNCHITAASCVPCRASLFTGVYPHTNGVVRNGSKWHKTWVSQLRDSGYHCVNIGKMHTNPFEADAGFSERYVVENKDRYLGGRYYFDEWDKALAANGLIKQQREFYRKRADYRTSLGAFEWELPEKLHSDMFVGGFAQWWLDTHPRTEPLFLQIGFPGPHPPYDPTRRYLDLYQDRSGFPPIVMSDEDLAGQPSYLHEKRLHDAEVDHDSIYWNPKRSTADINRMRAHYFANVTMIDDCIGDIIQALDRNGYLDDTIIFFASDHGDCLGDHGLSQKWSMYDVITRSPLIAWGPGRIEGGRIEDGLCQLFDVAPTILEFAGVEAPSFFEADSLMPAMTGERWRPRDHVFCEQAADNAMTGVDYITMVRNESWKLVHLKGTSEGQLFDLRNDPTEMFNLWDAPDRLETKRHLLDTIRDWLIDSNYHTRDRNADLR